MENTKYILNFLTQLSQNNNREWFTENKPQYQQANEYFISIVEQVISELAKQSRKWKGWIQKCVFRIYRDTRFSKDKTPYKTNFGASFSWGKVKELVKGYYMHFEPVNPLLQQAYISPILMF